MEFIRAFIVGGLICCVGQVLIDKTKLTSARILVLFVVAGTILGALGIYEPIVNFAGAGATVPLTGFGYNLAKSTFDAVDAQGLLGALTGGLTGGAAGISAAILFAFLVSLVTKPRAKS